MLGSVFLLAALFSFIFEGNNGGLGLEHDNDFIFQHLVVFGPTKAFHTCLRLPVRMSRATRPRCLSFATLTIFLIMKVNGDHLIFHLKLILMI